MVKKLEVYTDDLPELKAFNTFDVGIFGNVETGRGNLIGDLLIRFLGDDEIKIHCTPDGYLTPLLKNNSTGNSYKDLCQYFEIDFVIGLGLFGNTEQNWKWYFQSVGVTDVPKFVRFAKHYWKDHGLILQYENSSILCQLHNLRVYSRLPVCHKKDLSLRLNRLFNFNKYHIKIN